MDIQEVTSGAAKMQQWHKGQRTETSRKQGDILCGLQTNPQAGGREASSAAFHRAVESE